MCGARSGGWPVCSFPGSSGRPRGGGTGGGSGAFLLPRHPRVQPALLRREQRRGLLQTPYNVSQTEGSSWHTCIQTTFKTAEFGGLIGRPPAVTDHSGGNVRDTVYAETPLTELSESLWSVQQRAGYKHGCGRVELNPVACPQTALCHTPSRAWWL